MHTYIHTHTHTNTHTHTTGLDAHIQAPTREWPPVRIAAFGFPQATAAWSSTAPNTWTARLRGQAYGNGMYTVRGSSSMFNEATIAQWVAFDARSPAHNGAQWGNNLYNNGAWAGGTTARFTLDGSYYGDWMYIQLPEPVNVVTCNITANGASNVRAPAKFRIYGSNNGVTWTMLLDQTTAITYTNNEATVRVTAQGAYTYVGIVVSALFADASSTYMQINRLRIFGKVVNVVYMTIVAYVYTHTCMHTYIHTPVSWSQPCLWMLSVRICRSLRSGYSY
jgi:hypothetical protein